MFIYVSGSSQINIGFNFRHTHSLIRDIIHTYNKLLEAKEADRRNDLFVENNKSE